MRKEGRKESKGRERKGTGQGSWNSKRKSGPMEHRLLSSYQSGSLFCLPGGGATEKCSEKQRFLHGNNSVSPSFRTRLRAGWIDDQNYARYLLSFSCVRPGAWPCE